MQRRQIRGDQPVTLGRLPYLKRAVSLVARIAPPADDRSADDSAPGARLARMRLDEIVALRGALEAAVAAAREGMPVMLPPPLDAYDGGDEADQDGG
jgi:hypothetical protein